MAPWRDLLRGAKSRTSDERWADMRREPRVQVCLLATPDPELRALLQRVRAEDRSIEVIERWP